MTERDSRIKVLCEVLFGIRVIKYNVWEEHFKKVLLMIRQRELKLGLVIKLVVAVVTTLWSCTVSFMLLLTLGTYIGLGNSLSAAKAFTTFAVIDQLGVPLNSFSWNVNAMLDAWVSLKRIQSYLSLPDIRVGEYYGGISVQDNDGSDVEVEVKDGVFSWRDNDDDKENIENGGDQEKKEETKENQEKIADTKEKKENTDGTNIEENVNPFQLSAINVIVHKGKFVGITGKVGAGKSSLFASITAEIEKRDGSVYLSPLLDKEGIALFTQDPWIQHLSIRDNILFGRPFDDQRYNDVIHACALQEDIALFPASDSTEVGEKGVNLSGGQKARVALARAVYQDKGLYLLDDPMAALDAHVARHVYKHCIMGLLREKTRVLITHHTSYLHEADHVVLMKDGGVLKQGRPDEVLGGVLTGDGESEGEIPDSSSGGAGSDGKEEPDATPGSGQLIEDEEKRIGNVSWDVYKIYCKSCGVTIAMCVFLTGLMAQVSINMQNWWLAHWVQQSPTDNYNHQQPWVDFFSSTGLQIQQVGEGLFPSNAYYLSIFACFTGGYFISLGINSFLFAYGTFNACRMLHDFLLNSVMETPISFFDVTPVGRIVNRFSSDISEIDGELGFFLQMCVEQAFYLCGQVVIMCVSLPWFTLILVPLGIANYWIQRLYRISSRELKRISSVARSPIYEHFTETLSGCATIRAFREIDNFVETNQLKLDRSQRAEYNQELVALWLTFQFNMIGVVCVGAVAALAVLEHHFGTTNPGLVGLAITYAIQITPSLSWLLTVMTETEKQMVHVERVHEYISNTPKEVRKNTHIDTLWPHEGDIRFDSVGVTYREDLPLALDNVCFHVKRGEKIGICGRTGSGKSTLLKVLFGIIDVTAGDICIDGHNISDVDHTVLRSRMSIIPQDPFLFDDTLSRNLDPTRRFSTHEIFDVVEKCHLGKLVESLGGLEGMVGEKGNNLSNGQKQLLCLARALLRKSRIICIDEATASVDFETDKLIQETINEGFRESTVLTIAHRTHTIINCDKVLVMDMGQVKEFETPQVLLSDPTSEFYSLVHENSHS